MFDYHYNPVFPRQDVGKSQKNKPEWYANCIDAIIQYGISFNDRTETEKELNILHGDIPDEFYRKTLNPYNADEEKYRRFPATMRNYDIMSDVIRRYVSEYFKGIHEFIISANNPEIVLKKELKLQQEILQLAQQAFQKAFEDNWNQMQQQAQQNGTPLDQLNPQDAMPDPEEFIKNFNENYIDDESKQAQEVLNYIRSITQDVHIYLTAFFNYCSLGECYTYTEVRGREFIKECVPAIEAYPIPNSNFFVEDHDMFARRMLLSYSQIMSRFKDSLDKKDKEFLDRYYSDTNVPSSTRTTLMYSQYFESLPDLCEKFTDEERKLFKQEPAVIAAENNNLFEVWHVVWRGEVKCGILTRINQAGLIEQVVVEEGYKLNEELGDLDIQWIWKPQIYEGYRIGTRYTGIYPIKARALPYERDDKLPYNGLMEVLPMFGKFSIIKLITPLQIMRNIVSYHREMAIAKNKMLILLLPESLIMDKTEDKIYKMAADGTLIFDDSEDASGQKAQQIRLLNANIGTYITELGNLMETIKQDARELVDMNMQRYGEIAGNAVNATTQEAIARSSMGSVIVVAMFDEMRKRDYQRDLDYAKLAYIDGLETSYFDDKNNRRYISLDVNSYIYSQYSALVKNDQKELDKIQQLRQWAFNASQNGDIEMAKEAIVGDNVTQISAAIDKFGEIKRQHEQELKEMDMQLEQAKLQNQIAVIQAQGEEDRKTEALKYQFEMGIKSAEMENTNNQPTSNPDAVERNRIQENANLAKENLEREKLNLKKQELATKLYDSAANRQVKREDMDNKLKIARENKNKYDSKSSKK